MAENLIINGVDHAKFDLEWAKHGGCCIFDDSTDAYKQLILGKQVEERFIGARFFFRDHWVKFFCYFENYPTRMATPAECEAAGIEYIEYHGWRPIESVPKNGAIILIRHENDVHGSDVIITQKHKYINRSARLCFPAGSTVPFSVPSAPHCHIIIIRFK